MDRHVKLFVRSLAPGGARERQEAILTDLELLADHGVLTYEVVVWGNAVAVQGPAARTERGVALLERVATFEAWAEREGVVLAGDFDEREQGTLAGDPINVVSVPTMTLAEYRDAELVSVVPHLRDGTVHTVTDRLDALAAEVKERRAPSAD